MKSLFKCHLYYLMNKKTLIIIFISLFIGSLCFFSNIYTNKFITSNEEIEQYYETSVIMVKLILCFLAIFIFANSMQAYNDFYVYFIIPNNISRRKYIITKTLLMIFIVFLITFLLLLLYLFIGFIANKNFYLQSRFIFSFLILFLIASIYGLYTMILMQIFQNLYFVILSFLVVIFVNNLESDNLIAKTILFIFPNISNYPNSLISLIHLVYLNVLLVIINVFIYNNRDLNY